MKESLQLIFRIALAGLSRAGLRALCVFPVRKNRVLFQCYRELEYGCNPKYISEKLSEMYGDRLEIGWSFRNPEKFAFLKNKGVRVLKSGTLEGILYLLTSRVVCVNTYFKPAIPRRKGQYYIRTWHGGGAYKRVARMEKVSYLRRFYTNMQLSGANLYLSSSRAFTQMTVRDSFGFTGEVLEAGMPRNDFLVRGDIGAAREKARAALGVKDGQKLVLYAPTYRYDRKANDFELDYAGLTGALSERFGCEWTCAVRAHVLTRGGFSARGVKDASAYPDMQELLAAADALVTDYSSCVWDMSLMFKPVFLYATDLAHYQSARDFYTPIRSWPFPLAEDNEQLQRNILSFDEAKYRADVRAHHEKLGSCETGRAAEEAAKRIYDVCTGAFPRGQ